ncbi:50S ribosomal protein L30e [Candidatus Alkanophaga liquidiphilum]|nr:Ribosomal protein L30E [Candidatus Alkanophaga liquidiphilum]RLG36554.1 MAG: 50S ribosomal protein L30e [Candidatus Alkanophagales archaeon]
MLDVNRELQIAIRTGTVLMGTKQTLKALESGKGKLVIYAANCPVEVKEKMKAFQEIAYEYPGTNMELGRACGKPFSVAALCVIDSGESEILHLKRESE